MVKKQLYLVTIPSEFLLGDYQPCLHVGGVVVLDAINKEKFDITHIDFNAKYIKYHGNLEKYLDKGLLIDSIVDDMIPKKEYDYILISNLFTKITDILTLIITAYYSKKIRELYPNTEIVCGGYGWQSAALINFDEVTTTVKGKRSDGKIPGVDQKHYDHILKELEWPFMDNFKSDKIYLYQTEKKYHMELELWDILNTNRESGLTRYFNDGQYSKKESSDARMVMQYAMTSSKLSVIPDNIQDFKVYYPTLHPTLNYPDRFIQQAGLKFTIGCKNSCIYCMHATDGFQLLPMDTITDRFQSYLDAGFNSFFMLDALANSYIEKLCNWIAQKNLKISWSGSFALTEKTDLDYWKMVYEAGGRIIDTGCETIDDDQLNYINKRVSIDVLESAINSAHQAGLTIYTNYIFGLPYETKKAILSTLKFIEKHQHIVDGIEANLYRWKPTSLIGRNPAKYGIEVSKWHNYKIANGDTRVCEYLETDPERRMFDTYEEKAKFNLLNFDEIKEFLKNKNIRTEPFPPQHLIFALYDIFKEKSKVVQWLNEKYYGE